MAWRKLNSSNFVKPNDYEVGDVMVLGTFMGTRPTQFGEAFDFRSEDGTTVSIHGYQPILTQMEGVEPGTVCRITYEGTKKSKNQYNYHNFSVEISDGGPLADMDAEETVVATPTKRATAAPAAPAPLRKGPVAPAPVAEDDDEIEEVDFDDLDDDTEVVAEVAEVVKPTRRTTTTATTTAKRK